MLCARPPEDGAASGPHQAPFRSTVAAAVGDQLGLPPPKREGPICEVKTRGPSAALRRHCQWIRELQEQVQEDQRQVADDNQAQADRKERMQKAFKVQRDAIRQMKKERDRDDIQAADVEAILRSGGKGTRKPMWAMTQDEQDRFKEEDAEELIKFAEELDFDKYIDDMEFRQNLQIVRDRAKKLQKEQDAFKDSVVREFNLQGDSDEEDEYVGEAAPSISGAGSVSRRPGPSGGKRPDWDASTVCSDDRLSVEKDRQSAASRAMEANPQLRSVHSKGSVQKLIEKAQEKQPDQALA